MLLSVYIILYLYIMNCVLCRAQGLVCLRRYPTQLQLPDGRLVSYGGYYSLWGEPNPWVGETGVQALPEMGLRTGWLDNYV
jgi:hypothetical protein